MNKKSKILLLALSAIIATGAAAGFGKAYYNPQQDTFNSINVGIPKQTAKDMTSIRSNAFLALNLLALANLTLPFIGNRKKQRDLTP